MRNILVIVGSARKKGNTDVLADAFIKGAEDAGHRVIKFHLGEVQVNGCLGCDACRFEKPCVQPDDMQDIYRTLAECDTVVMASPLYYWTISARLKAFLERLYAIPKVDNNPPLGRYEKYPDKACALIVTAADDLFWTFEHVVSYYRLNVIRYLGWTDKGVFLAGGCHGDVSKNDTAKYLEDAYKFGKNI